tara:strand:+ start:136 stop:330 length:195 start_codon:yes stop_codon:yes gene_type:complete
MKTKTLYSDYEQWVIDGRIVNWYKMMDKSGKLVVEGVAGEIKDYVHLMYHTYNTKVLIKGNIYG